MLPNLKKEMDRRGIKQCRLAQVAGVSERTVYSWLNQDGEPGVFRVRQLDARFFPTFPVITFSTPLMLSCLNSPHK